MPGLGCLRQNVISNALFIISLLQKYFRDKLEFVAFLFVVNSFNFENHRSYSVRTAGNHHIFFFQPAFHNRTTLQTCVNITRNSIPCFRTKWHFRSSCNSIWICIRLNKGIYSHVPKVISFIITIENKFIANKINNIFVALTYKPFNFFETI